MRKTKSIAKGEALTRGQKGHVTRAKTAMQRALDKAVREAKLKDLDHKIDAAVANAMQDKIWAHFDQRMRDEIRVVFDSQRKEPWFKAALQTALKEVAVAKAAPAPWWKFW